MCVNIDNSFKQYYKFPLKTPWDYSIKVFTNDNHMAFDWLYNISNETKSDILDCINGKNIVFSTIKDFRLDNGVIYCKLLDKDEEIPLLRIRGWGMLIGIGGYNLDNETAMKIQDNFANYCLKKLKNE